MLKILSGFGSGEAEGILSSVALSLLPKPTLAPEHGVDEYLYRRILDESKERLSIDPDDETAAARSRVVDFLGNQISESVLHGADVTGIEARLHQSDIYRTAPGAATDMVSTGDEPVLQIREEDLAVGKR